MNEKVNPATNNQIESSEKYCYKGLDDLYKRSCSSDGTEYRMEEIDWGNPPKYSHGDDEGNGGI